ncbi:TAXI family TRAP transporter solute-binding subunit [Natrialbaceae archaeon A-gly3]
MTHERNHTRRAFLGAVGAGGLLGATTTLTTANAGTLQDETWTLGTSAEGSSSFRIGSTWAEYFSREGLFENVEVEAVVTEGTGATYRRVDADDLELGGSTTQLLEDSPDEGPYEDAELTDFESIRQLRGYMSFNNFGLVNLDAGVETFDDLEGRPVAISSSGSGTRPPVEYIVDQEIGLDNIDNRYMAFADIPAALRGGVVDAAFTWTVNETTPQGWFEEIDATVDWAPLELSDETIQQLEEEVAFSSYVELGEDTVTEFAEEYTGPIDSFTLTYVYVGKSDLDPDLVEEVTRLTYEHGDELLDQDPIMDFFPDPDLFLGQLHPDVPLHEGAYRFYEEEGLLEDYDLTPPPEVDGEG